MNSLFGKDCCITIKILYSPTSVLRHHSGPKMNVVKQRCRVPRFLIPMIHNNKKNGTKRLCCNSEVVAIQRCHKSEVALQFIVDNVLVADTRLSLPLHLSLIAHYHKLIISTFKQFQLWCTTCTLPILKTHS